MSILIIDDDADILQRLKKVLEHRGFDVVTAQSGGEGLTRLLQVKPELVLLDLVLPDMPGLEVLEEIKRLSPESSVVIISAFAGVSDAVEAMKRGASDILVKPFHIEELVNTVRKTIEEAKLEHKFEARVDEEVIKALSNPVRRQVVLHLYNSGTSRFSSIARSLQIEDASKLSYHLRVLAEAGIITKSEAGDYSLTPEGRAIVKKLVLRV
jgi:DNA-binding NtrC family response regulator